MNRKKEIYLYFSWRRSFLLRSPFNHCRPTTVYH